MPPLVRETLPAGAVLLLAALAERSGAGTAAFYLLLAGIPVSAAAALAALDRLVAAGAPADRARALLGALLVTLFTLGAAASSPVLGEVRDAAPGLAGAAIVVGLVVVGALAATELLPGEAVDDVGLDRSLLALDLDLAEGAGLGPVRELPVGRRANDDLPDVGLAL